MAQAGEHPHAPELGWARRVLGAMHVTGVFWFRFPYYGLRWVPRGPMAIVVLFFALPFFLVLRRIRVALASNLEAVLGPCGFWERQRRIFRTIHAFAWCFAERYEALHKKPGFSVSVDGMEHLERVLRSGSGLIFVTAHVGHWETASRMISTSLDRHVHVVREEELDPRAQAFTEEILSRAGTTGYTTHFASEDPRLGLVLVEALHKGDVVALQGDRPRTRGRSFSASLLGRPMPLPVGPAALARAAGVPLVPIFSLREGRRRYRVCLRPPIRVAREGQAGLDLAGAVKQIAAEIEWAIRRAPHQWFCFKRLWA